MSQETSSICLQRVSPSASKNASTGLAVTTGRSPDQAAGVVIDDDGQVALTLAMRDLIDPDPSQTVEQIDLALRLIADAFADRADRPPGDTHQLRDSGLRRVDGQPPRLVLKRPGEPRVVTRHGTAQTTTPCRRQRTLGASASTNASVVPRSNARQRRRPSPRSYPGLRRRQTPQRSRSRHTGLTATMISSSEPICTSSTTTRCKPSSRAHTLVLRTSHLAPLDSSRQEAGTLGAARRAPIHRGLTDPREQQERPKSPETLGFSALNHPRVPANCGTRGTTTARSCPAACNLASSARRVSVLMPSPG
jgi:hypothetical protein